jgi:hypothetical protein
MVVLSNTKALSVTTGVTWWQCDALCGRLRRARLCAKTLYTAEAQTCVILSHNVTTSYLAAPLKVNGFRSDLLSRLVDTSSNNPGGTLSGVIANFGNFQRLAGYYATQKKPWKALESISGLPLEACLDECEQRIGPGNARCAFVSYKRADELCLLHDGEVSVRPDASGDVYVPLEGRKPQSPPSAAAAQPGRAAVTSLEDPIRDAAFAVLAADKYIQERLVPALQTWMRHQRVLILMEETGVPLVNVLLRQTNVSTSMVVPYLEYRNPFHGKGTVSFAFLKEPTHKIIRSVNGAWKNLAGITAMVAWSKSMKRPLPKWWLMVDDDTFVFPNTMQFYFDHIRDRVDGVWRSAIALRKFDVTTDRDPTESIPLYFGAVFVSNYEREVINNMTLPPGKFVHKRTLFIQGGAGIVMNRVALETMAAHTDTCTAICTDWAGDIRLGCCSIIAGIGPPLFHPGFHSEGVSKHVTELKSELAGFPFPVTFHVNRDAESFLGLWRVAQQEAKRNRLVAWRPISQYVTQLELARNATTEGIEWSPLTQPAQSPP